MNICVIGAGNGGQVLAGYLALKGFDVSLFNKSEMRILPIMKTRKIRLEGEVNATAQVSFATTNLAEAVRGRKLLMIVVPANVHREIAEKLAPLLEDGQIVVLNPGRTAGALEFVNVLNEKGVKKDTLVAEAQTFVFTLCMSNLGVVRIFRIKNAVPVAALPASRNKDLEETLLKVMPEFEIVPSALYTSFNNIGAVFHPATIILNAGRVETMFGKFEFYFEGISSSVAKVLEAIDEERCAVSRELGIEPMTAVQWLSYAYNVKGRDLYEAIHNNEGYRAIQAPTSLEKQIHPVSRLVNVETPTLDSIVRLASFMMGIDFFKEGRNFKRLCLEGKTTEEVKRIMEEGWHENDRRFNW